MSEFSLGDRVRCRVTGVEGIATAYLRYLNGCVQYGVSQKVGQDGKVPDTLYIDHTQLELVEEAAVTVKSADTGGAMTRRPM